jgi:hypothetical protein
MKSFVYCLLISFMFSAKASEITESPGCHGNYYGRFEGDDFVVERHITYLEAHYGETSFRGHKVFMPYGKGNYNGILLDYEMSPQELAEHLLLLGPIKKIEPTPLKEHIKRKIPYLTVGEAA